MHEDDARNSIRSDLRHTLCGLHPPHSMSSGSIAGGSDSEDLSIAEGGSEPPERVQKRRGRVVPKLRPYMLLASDKSPPSGGGRDGGRHAVIGVALAKIVVSPLNSPFFLEAQRSLPDMATRRLDNRRKLRGPLKYNLEQMIMLCAPFALGDGPSPDAELHDTIADCESKLRDWSNRTSGPQARRARTLMGHFGTKKLLPIVSAVVDDNTVDGLFAGECRHIHCVAISGKVARKRSLVYRESG